MAKLVTFESPSADRSPSSTIWADCPGAGLIANGKGYWFHDEFLGGVADTVAANEQRPIVGHTFNLDCDDDTVLSFKASEDGGYQDIETDGDNGDGWAFFTEPFCKLTKGRKVWLEGRLELGDADAQQAFFFGLAEEAALSRDFVNDDCDNLITETMIGFRLFDEEDAIDVIAQKDASAEVVIASDVTNLDVLDAVLGSGSKAALADNTEIKLGLCYDGDETVEFFVNSVRIIGWSLDSTYYDATKSLAFLAGLKVCDDGDAQSAAFDWVQGAATY